MVWPGSGEKATPDGLGNSDASPIRRGEIRWRKGRSALDLVDLGEDLLVLREAIGHLVVVHELPVDLHGEDSSSTFLQISGDAVLVPDGGLQTGGLGQVVSLAAIDDRDVHPILLCVWLARMIRSASGPVKCRF